MTKWSVQKLAQGTTQKLLQNRQCGPYHLSLLEAFFLTIFCVFMIKIIKKDCSVKVSSAFENVHVCHVQNSCFATFRYNRVNSLEFNPVLSFNDTVT